MIVNIVRSRQGDERIVKNCGGGCYTIEGKSLYHRLSYTEDETEIAMFDFEGGPCFFANDTFDLDPSNPNLVIEKIVPEDHTRSDWAKVTVLVRQHLDDNYDDDQHLS